jgi:hypothetical protein
LCFVAFIAKWYAIGEVLLSVKRHRYGVTKSESERDSDLYCTVDLALGNFTEAAGHKHEHPIAH